MPRQVPEPILATGNEWSYDIMNAYNGEREGAIRRRVVAVGSTSVRCELSSEGRDGVASESYARGWNIVRRVAAPGLGELTFEPPLRVLAFPLEAGQHWVARATGIDAITRRSNRVSAHVRVLGWARVKVPAGEFDAIVIRRVIYLGDGDVFRTENEVVETEWYSPSVKAVVRSDVTSSYYATASPGDPGGAPRMRGAWEIASLTAWQS